MKQWCSSVGSPKISVVMLTYNRETFIGRAIEAILSQTFTDFELLIIDNGSTDLSGAIADEYAIRDSRVQVIHRDRGNIGSGRNAGISLSSGKYITFVDDDDYAEPDFLEFLLNLAEKYDADIAVCGSYKEEDGTRTNNHIYSYNEIVVMNAETATEMFLWRKLYNAAMPTKLIKRQLVSNYCFPEEGVYDDISTTYKYFAGASTVVAHGLPKYTFYRHPGNNSSAATKHHLLNAIQLEEYLVAFRERSEYIRRVLPQLYDLALYSEWSYMISMIEKIHRYQLQGTCAAPFRYMFTEIRNNYREFYYGKFIQDFEKTWVEECLL